jgi:hypothetical protein
VKIAAVLALGLAAATAHAQGTHGYVVMPTATPAPMTIPAATPVAPPTDIPVITHDGCGGGCCATQKICVLEPKEKTKVLYCTREKEFCIKSCGCHLFGGHHGCDSDCGGCGSCQLRCKKVLIKKVVPDCPDTKCVLHEVPVEAAPCASAPCSTCGPKHH